MFCLLFSVLLNDTTNRDFSQGFRGLFSIFSKKRPFFQGFGIFRATKRALSTFWKDCAILKRKVFAKSEVSYVIRSPDRRAQCSAVPQNDPDPGAKAHPEPCGPHHPQHAHHQHLQPGRYLFRRAAVHQRIGRSGRGLQPDGHHPGAGLYAGPRCRRHHQPQPGQPGYPRRHKICLHQLFHGAGFRHRSGPVRPCHPARFHDAAGQHRDDPAPCLCLCAAHPVRCAGDDLQPGDEQHPPLRGQGQLCHDRPGHRRLAEHRAGPGVHLRVRHGHRRRGPCHGPEPVRQLWHPAFHVSAGPHRQPVQAHGHHPQRAGFCPDPFQRRPQLWPTGPEQHRQHAAEHCRPRLRRRRRGRHEHRLPHLPVHAVRGHWRGAGPAARGGL